MGKVEISARKTGSDQFLVGCQCEKEGDKSLFSLSSEVRVQIKTVKAASEYVFGLPLLVRVCFLSANSSSKENKNVIYSFASG